MTVLNVSCCSEKREVGDAGLLAGVLDSSVGTTSFLIPDPNEEMSCRLFLLGLIRTQMGFFFF